MNDSANNSAGLRGQVAGETELCTVGKSGTGLTYRGYEINDLADNAELAWENITSNIPNAQRTVQHFNEALEEFYLRYVADDAKDTMCSYLN